MRRPLQVLPGSEIKRSTKTAWDKEVQFEVDGKDRFVLRPDTKVRVGRGALIDRGCCVVMCLCKIGRPTPTQPTPNPRTKLHTEPTPTPKNTQNTPQDYAKLSEEELAATVTDGAVSTQEAHTTFIPHSHPFAHARLLNVVCRVASLDKTTKFYEGLGFINLRERTTQDYSAVVMGFG